MLTIASSLPRFPGEVGILIIQSRNFRGDLSSFKVRREYIRAAITWLVEKNPHYRHFEINPHALSSTPLNGVPVEFVATVTTDEFDNEPDTGVLKENSVSFVGPVVNSFSVSESLAPQEESAI